MRQQHIERLLISGPKGFSLIEVMMAIVILSVGILGVASMQISATNKTASAAKMTRADSWVSSQTAEITRLGYTDPGLNPTIHVPDQASDEIDNDNDGEVDETGETGPIQVLWAVTQDTPLENCKSITLTIQDGTGPAWSVQYIRADII